MLNVYMCEYNELFIYIIIKRIIFMIADKSKSCYSNKTRESFVDLCSPSKLCKLTQLYIYIYI